jgi:hypothetical protein
MKVKYTTVWNGGFVLRGALKMGNLARSPPRVDEGAYATERVTRGGKRGVRAHSNGWALNG